MSELEIHEIKMPEADAAFFRRVPSLDLLFPPLRVVPDSRSSLLGQERLLMDNAYWQLLRSEA